MFKRSIVLGSGDDARRILDVFDTEVQTAGLPPQTEQFLREQIETTLLQFERQLTSGSVQKIVADRVFEGDGYRVTVRVRHGTESVVDKLKNLFGMG